MVKGDLQRGKAKVKWKDCCLPLQQGGLGLKSLKTWNDALMAKHTWNIITHKKSLWVRWVYKYHLKGMSFWEVSLRKVASWGWRKILQQRDLLRNHIVSIVGDGKSTSAWFDNWHPCGPLDRILSPRNINEGDFNRATLVADVLTNHSWKWPDDWVVRFPLLANYPPIHLTVNVPDRIVWRTNEGIDTQFHVGLVWKDIRQATNEVPWFRLVWFSQNIPRHAFTMWLAIKNKLRTHDVVKGWNINTEDKCYFCKRVPDSIPHLFFECEEPARIWQQVSGRTKWGHITGEWGQRLEELCRTINNNSIWSIVNRLVFAATVYYIWQERNLRQFENCNRPVEDLSSLILETVRLRILSLRVKRSSAAMQVWKHWDIGRLEGREQEHLNHLP
ncbi:hypothetical protein R6Q59_033646 [Mikania micrantha]